MRHIFCRLPSPMDEAREKEIELKAKDDKASSKGPSLATVLTLGLADNNHYSPPSDPVEKTVYDHHYFKK